MVNENYSVTGVRDRQWASPFYIIQPEDRDNPNEFLIGYYKEFGGKGTAAQQTRGEQPLARYLESPVSIFGYNDGPLKVKHNVKEEYCRYVLHDRLHKRQTQVEVTDWISGSEAFYINCSGRRFARDGYLGVKKVQGSHGDEPTFITACFPSVDYHDDSNVFMLFHLLRPTPRQLAESRSEQAKGIMSQLECISGTAIPGLAVPTTV